MDDVRENDQCLFYTAVSIILVAESKEELESVTETVETIGKRHSVTIDTHYLRQREALNTALPHRGKAGGDHAYHADTVPCGTSPIQRAGVKRCRGQLLRYQPD